MSEPTRCERCRFWQPDRGSKSGSLYGECRRHAPLPRTDTQSAYWASTSRNDWCGEYQFGTEKVHG